MFKRRTIHFIMSMALLALFSLSMFGGTAFAATRPHSSTPNFVPCDTHEQADVTLESSNFVSRDVTHTIINNTPANIVQTITTSATTTLSATVSSTLSGKANFIFSEASIQLGLSVTGSFSVFVGTATAITAVAHKTTYIQHGMYQDTLFVHDYWVNVRCNIYNETYGSVTAPQTNDVWKVWTN